jgi:hypothetical protein
MKTLILIAAAVLTCYVFYVLLSGIYHLVKKGTPPKTNYPLMIFTFSLLLVLLFIYIEKGYYHH